MQGWLQGWLQSWLRPWKKVAYPHLGVAICAWLCWAVTSHADDGASSAGMVPEAGSSAKPNRQVRKGFVDFNGYYDTRGFSVVTINMLANLTRNVQYFSLTNYSGNQNSGSPLDLSEYLTEQNLRWSAFGKKSTFGLSTQWVHRTGEDNDMLRVGVRWRAMDARFLKKAFAAVGLRYFVTFFPAQLDFVTSGGYRAQIEHVYRLHPFARHLQQRLYVAGFLDHNFWFRGPTGTCVSTVLTEHQVGFRFFGNFYAVAELRRNEFMVSQKNGLGIGLEYVVPFEIQ